MTSPTDPQAEPRREGISLDDLTEAFAKVMGQAPPSGAREAEASGDAGDADQPAEHAGQPAAPPKGAAADAAEDAAPTDRDVLAGAGRSDEPGGAVDPASILEAMLFVGAPGGEPLRPAHAAELMRGVRTGEIPGLVEQLNRRYAARGCPYHVVGEGSGYRLTLRPAYHRLRSRFYGKIREARLSQAAVDVLAIVAYRQPVTAEEVGRQRGRPSGPVLAQLVRRGLLRVERKGDGRPAAHYLTTERFLRLFGLESLDDLPRTEDMERP
jgi:segregation and condensation protein B